MHSLTRRILPPVLLLALACGGSVAPTGPGPGDLPDLPDLAASDTGTTDPGADGPGADGPGAGRLAVLTFNLRTAFGADGENAWENRKALAAAVVRDRDPDVMGTQEGILTQLDDLATLAPGWAWVGEPRTDSIIDEHCAVFYRTSRFSLLDSGTFWLSETPEVEGSAFPDQLLPRIVTWARLRGNADGRELFVFNTHLDHGKDVVAKQRAAALIVRRIDEIAGDAPVVLTGDFNTAPGSETYAILTGSASFEGATGSLSDPWTDLGAPEEGTFHGFDGIPGDSRIDWILRSKHFESVSVEVVKDHQGPVWPSDHFPVEAELSIP